MRGLRRGEEAATNVEFQIVFDGNTIFNMPFRVEDERQLADNFKQRTDAFREAHADSSLLDEDVLVQWRRMDSV